MFTLADIRTAVVEDQDLEGEDFISLPEIDRHIRRGVNSAENLILGLNEDYFLDKAPLTLVAGQADYALPEGIYGHKIRSVIFKSGESSYLIRRIKKLYQTAENRTGCDYQYLITSPSESKITLYPPARESGDLVTIWFLRNANKLTDDDDILNIPEAFDYVVQFAKDQCENKERKTPDAPPSAALKEEEALLIGALMNRVPDDDNELEADTSFYEECN